MKIFNSILSKLSGNATEKQKAFLEEWLTDDPANKQDMDLYETIWRESGQMKDFVLFEPGDAWNKISDKIEDESEARTTRIRPLRRNLAIAASILILVVSGIWILLNKNPYVTMDSGNEPLAEIVLPDGTTVLLGANSSLAYNLHEFRKADERVVFLKGEGRFDVAEDLEKPFKVESYPAGVSILGTIFIAKSDSIVSTVENIEGQILFFDLKDEENNIIVNEGESFSFDGSSFEDLKPPPPPPPPPPPLTGSLVPIIDIIDEMDWSFPGKVVVAPYMEWDDEVARIDWDQSLANIFLQLDSTSNITYVYKNGAYYISGFGAIADPK